MPTTLNPLMIDDSVPLNLSRGTINSLFSNDLTAVNISATNIISNSLIGNNLTATNFKATQTELTNLTALGNVTTYITVLSTTSNITFNDSYNSKIIHIDTTATPTASAIFPSSISNGFNVSIINAGTGTIFVSAQNGLNAPGNINAIPYTAMFIYKANNQFFGIGAFE